jgi:hypothetical protein
MTQRWAEQDRQWEEEDRQWEEEARVSQWEKEDWGRALEWQEEQDFKETVAMSLKPVENQTCSVCLTEVPVSSKMTTTCGHHFHTECIDKWIRTTRMANLARNHDRPITCPNCRASILRS